jgi:hypothetical protein
MVLKLNIPYILHRTTHASPEIEGGLLFPRVLNVSHHLGHFRPANDPCLLGHPNFLDGPGRFGNSAAMLKSEYSRKIFASRSTDLNIEVIPCSVDQRVFNYVKTWNTEFLLQPVNSRVTVTIRQVHFSSSTPENHLSDGKTRV